MGYKAINISVSESANGRIATFTLEVDGVAEETTSDCRVPEGSTVEAALLAYLAQIRDERAAPSSTDPHPDVTLPEE